MSYFALREDTEEVLNMTKLTATYEGQTFKRSTDRTYTHVIIVKDEGKAWKAVSWAGSLVLAQKRISEFTQENTGNKNYSGRGLILYSFL